jgi:pyruvate dehydrogenase E1 component
MTPDSLQLKVDRHTMHIVGPPHGSKDVDPAETREWIDAFEGLTKRYGEARARFILESLIDRAQRGGLNLPSLIQTSYVNTIPASSEAPYPGDEALEKTIRRIIRWNAAVMVIRANHFDPGIGGHLATYASAATLYEVGFNHFFRGKNGGVSGDHIYFQGHSSPGIYARAFLEGRLTRERLANFRHESGGAGLSSYPHPRLMPDFWEFPTVSMGLGPLAAIYQARFNRYMRDRGIKDTDASRVWAFVGDGECDEPETLGALAIAARERLDNLAFVVNCNLQRLDGPVRGNGKIIQELEAVFRGSGWNVIKVIWGCDWDPLLTEDTDGLLARRMNEAVDGDYQKYSVEPGSYTRKHFFGKYPQLLNLVENLTDNQIRGLRRGGHDHHKVYTAYRAAVDHKGGPTAILAKTVKGWALGEGAEGRNAAHQTKKLNVEQMKKFRDELHLPIPDADLEEAPFYLPAKGDPIYDYLRERRSELGGDCPRRVASVPVEEIPPLTNFGDLLVGSGEAEASTTRAFAKILADLLKDEKFGKRVVPIIPDEARTFGLDGLFKRFGIYSSVGQVYQPVDSEMLITYREAKDGQVLEEGICEAGAMATFTAAGTSYATHDVTMIPLYIFYSMFGYQRTGDQVWAFGDARGKGFLLGATAGRTTLNGEGLQHQDGHSPLLFSAVPNVRIYDPAYAYELAVIVRDGLARMYAKGEDCFYYITLYNENYPMPPMPAGVEEGILRGLYKFRAAPKVSHPKSRTAQILGSGTILREALRAQELLAEKFHVAADVWSATSYTQLRRDALAAERWNRLHPEENPRSSWVADQLAPTHGPIVATSDYMKAVPDQIARWLGPRFLPLGTDGYGMSDSRPALRRHFEVDAEHVTVAVLHELSKKGAVGAKEVSQAIRDLGIDPDRMNPADR